MSVSFYAKTVLGFEVSRTNFLTVVGTKTTCGQGHQAKSPEEKFCSECGEKFTAKPIEHLTPEFLKWGATLFPKERPEDYWELLCDDPPGRGAIRILRIRNDAPDRLFLGFVLGSYSHYRGFNNVEGSFLAGGIHALEEKLDEAAKALKVGSPPTIFTLGSSC